MCGIFALLNSSFNNDNVNNEFMKGKSRGPEFSKLDYSYLKMTLGFHRLAINGLNNESNQPLVINDIVLICNGEIYNYQDLYENMNITPVTGSDCEVIIHLYIKYGIEQTLIMLDGVFSFILYDNPSPNVKSPPTILPIVHKFITLLGLSGLYIIRKFGLLPLIVGCNPNPTIALSSFTCLRTPNFILSDTFPVLVLTPGGIVIPPFGPPNSPYGSPA